MIDQTGRHGGEDSGVESVVGTRRLQNFKEERGCRKKIRDNVFKQKHE